MELTAQTTVYLLTLVIYIIILYIFDRARVKFKGGNLAMVIKLIIINTVYFLSQTIHTFLNFLGTDIVYISRTILRLAAMCALAFGGLRLIST